MVSLRRSCSIVLLGLSLCGGCAMGDGRGGADAGPSDDAGAGGGIDAGPAMDAGEERADAGAAFDAGARPMDAGVDAGRDAGVDAGTDAGFDSGVSAADCLVDWRMYPAGSCPAPIITASYVGNGCVGTTGWFVEGANFQLNMRRTGVADLGPQSIGVNGNQSHWNVIREDLLCVTVAPPGRTWIGATIHVVNPDGQASNSVVVTNRL